jgi:hypothetical protein
MEIRIKERELLPGELVTTFVWPNPKPPKPLRPRYEKHVKEQAKLDNDKRAFALRCIWNGL